MKLNNKGWGLSTLLILSSIILVFLLVAVYYITQLYTAIDENAKSNNNIINTIPNNQNNNQNSSQNNNSDPDSNNNSSAYAQIENNISDAAKDYVSTYYTSLNMATIVINIKNLQEISLIETIIDQQDKSVCSGYALVDVDEDKNLISSAYIKCSNYTTNGYQDWRIND